MRYLPVLFALFAFAAVTPHALAEDVSSGPDPKQKVAPLKVFDVTGEHASQQVDYPAKRGVKPTVYLFVPADKWSRPTARFIRKLDELVAEHGKDLYMVAVWLTEDKQKSKTYLPRAQRSIKLKATALTVFEGDKSGPAEGWIVNPDADVTAVVAVKGKVVKSFGFVSANETVVQKVWKVAKAAAP